MAVFKFLFVLALAVPLAVFMWNYINKLSDEFQENVAHGKGSSATQKTSAPAPQKKEKSKKPAKKSGLGRKKRSARTDEKSGGRPAASAKAPAREQRQSYGSSRGQAQEGYQAGIGQRQVSENYGNLRSNFEHSKMKQRYEESLREGSESQKTQKPRKKADKPESKRARRKARKKERELRNRETRR